jgi:hypothetical protein
MSSPRECGGDQGELARSAAAPKSAMKSRRLIFPLLPSSCRGFRLSPSATGAREARVATSGARFPGKKSGEIWIDPQCHDRRFPAAVHNLGVRKSRRAGCSRQPRECSSTTVRSVGGRRVGIEIVSWIGPVWLLRRNLRPEEPTRATGSHVEDQLDFHRVAGRLGSALTRWIIGH